MSINLSISLVVCRSDIYFLNETLDTLYQAVCYAQNEQIIDSYSLFVVDNDNFNNISNEEINESIYTYWKGKVQKINPNKNLGYGMGNNLVINSYCESLHLVINPDVRVDKEAIINAVNYMNCNQEVGLLTPRVSQIDTKKEHLCKTYPSVFILLLRGFAPKIVQLLFKKQLERYEISNLPLKENKEIELASGCFMFFRKEALIEIKGFSPYFFLYFEDSDLSLRIRKNWKIAYNPSVKIFHYGGYTTKKGFKHIKLFIHSAYKFYNIHGWKFI